MKNLFNQVAGKVKSSVTQGQAGAAGSVGLMQALIGMFSGEGGVAGLVNLFQDKGLGDTVASWTGNGPNLPISADQVLDVLGKDRVGRLAQETSLSPDAVTGGLSTMLPQMMDSLTPDGVLPDGAGIKERLSALAGKLL